MSPAPIYLGIALACAFMLALAACDVEPDLECTTLDGGTVLVRYTSGYGSWLHLADGSMLPREQVTECHSP